MARLKFDIVTAERLVSSDEIDTLVVPGREGELTVLPNHAPLLTILNPGELRIIKESQEDQVVITGGFMEVLGNKVTILADSAEFAEEIDVERAEEALRRAEERMESRGSDMDLERTLASMKRSRARISVARRKRRTDSL